MSSPLTTKVQIANLALDILDAQTISSFEETTIEAQKMKAYYELYIQSALTRHEWSFAMSEMQASLLAASPIPQWEYAYELPADMLQLKTVLLSNSAGSIMPYKTYQLFENNTLCTDTGNGIWVFYLKRVFESRWPAYFVDFVTNYLAIKLAPMIGRQFSLQKQLIETMYGIGDSSTFRIACEADATQSVPKAFDTSYLQAERERF